MTIYCVGRNYVKHAQELGNEVPAEPLIFLKAESSLRELSQGELAFPSETFHYEAELVLTIGRDLALGEEVTAEDIEFISLGIDLTRREVQNTLKAKGLPWTMAKSFAGSAMTGRRHHFSKFKNKDLVFELKVNGELRQRGETKNMIFSFLALCGFINSFSPLKKGDLIFTGTPEGVGEIRKGSKIEMKLENEEEETGII